VDLIPVTSVKNWLYCPRQVYFVEACGLEAPPSWKMREGQLAQQERERLEERRSLFGYGLRDRKRLYGLRLASNSLGIAGSPDLVLEGGGQAAVVEFKLTAGDADPATWLQLACYAALVEEVRRVPVDWIYAVRLSGENVGRKPYTGVWRARIREVLAGIRTCVDRQVDPGPCSDPAKCADCPYRNFCGDRW
jgi:CRISPR-associated exonuclease Cas4